LAEDVVWALKDGMLRLDHTAIEIDSVIAIIRLTNVSEKLLGPYHLQLVQVRRIL